VPRDSWRLIPSLALVLLTPVAETLPNPRRILFRGQEAISMVLLTLELPFKLPAGEL